MKSELTAERLRSKLQYEPLTGVFTRAVSIAKFKAGEMAGCVVINSGKRYIRIGVDGSSYYAQRLAWLHMTGHWPTNEVDHINGDPSDNRWINLRDVTGTVNRQNQHRAHKDNPVGVLGVSWSKKRQKFRASLTINRKPFCLGYFDEIEDARRVYVEAKRLAHEGCML